MLDDFRLIYFYKTFFSTIKLLVNTSSANCVFFQATLVVTSAEMSWTAREGGARIRGQGGGGNRPLRFWQPYLNLGGMIIPTSLLLAPLPRFLKPSNGPGMGRRRKNKRGLPSSLPHYHFPNFQCEILPPYYVPSLHVALV